MMGITKFVLASLVITVFALDMIIGSPTMTLATFAAAAAPDLGPGGGCIQPRARRRDVQRPFRGRPRRPHP
jgi:hypothetical protein